MHVKGAAYASWHVIEVISDIKYWLVLLWFLTYLKHPDLVPRHWKMLSRLPCNRACLLFIPLLLLTPCFVTAQSGSLVGLLHFTATVLSGAV